MIRIYFDDKPLTILTKFLPDADKKTFVINHAAAKDIEEAVRKISTYDQVAMITPDPSKLFEAFKKNFTIIRAAGGLVYDKNKLLFIFRKGKWDLPKGKLDAGESLDLCAVREVQEETGIQDLETDHAFYTSYHTYTEKEKNILKETHWYLMKGDAAQLLSPQVEEGIEECIWVSSSEKEKYLDESYALVREVVMKGLEIIAPDF